MKLFTNKPFWLLLLAVLAFAAPSFSQSSKLSRFDFSSSIGASFLMDKQPGMKSNANLYAQLAGHVNFPISKNFFLTTGLGLESSMVSIEGQFTKTGNDYGFEQVPDNFEKNTFTLTYINVPLLVRKSFVRGEKEMIVGLGPVFSYLASSKQTATVDGEKFKSDPPIESRFRYGANLDLDFRGQGFMGTRHRYISAVGLLYQLSENVKGVPSFNPFAVYLRFGIGFTRRTAVNPG